MGSRVTRLDGIIEEGIDHPLDRASLAYSMYAFLRREERYRPYPYGHVHELGTWALFLKSVQGYVASNRPAVRFDSLVTFFSLCAEITQPSVPLHCGLRNLVWAKRGIKLTLGEIKEVIPLLKSRRVYGLPPIYDGMQVFE